MSSASADSSGDSSGTPAPENDAHVAPIADTIVLEHDDELSGQQDAADGERRQQPRLQFQEGLTALVHQLNRSTSAAAAFGIFVEAVESMFPGLAHVSLLLLPSIKSQQAGGAPAAPVGAPPVPLAPGITTAAPRKAAKQQSKAAAAAAAAAAGGDAAGGGASADAPPCELDWGNTCLFHLSKARGAVVQPHPDWPLVCSAAYHAARVSDGVVTTSNYGHLGPHFLDWHALAEGGNVAMTSVPIYCWKQPVAVLTMASRDAGAFDSEDAMVLLSALLSPYVQTLEFATRRSEMERLVHNVLTPLAAELSVRQGRFKRVKNANGEDVLCLDESRSSHRRDASAAAAKGAPEATAPPNSRTLALIQSSSSMGVRISGSASMAAAPSGDNASGPANGQPRSADSAPSSSKQLAVEAVDLAYVDQPDLDWSDFLFNVISMCIVYAYFSKAAVSSESITAVLLCMAVASLDIVLLLMKWICYDHYLNYGLVLCVFQIYRAMLLPVVNAWMLWSLIHKLGLEPSPLVHALEGACLLLCYLLAVKYRFMLVVPVQLVTVVFSATTAAATCGAAATTPQSVLCMTFVTFMQLFLGLVCPTVMTHLLDSHRGRNFMPHVQARRWVLQA